MDAAQLASLHPTLYHMAEDGTWPSIRERGLLSTRAIIDLYQPDEKTSATVLSSVRQTKITLTSTDFGDITIRDQLPAKFLEKCMDDGVDPADFLDALNSRVFFWVSLHRLERLLNARYYRHLRHTVLRIDTAALLEEYADEVQLAPYNTGSMHVPTAPKRGPGTGSAWGTGKVWTQKAGCSPSYKCAYTSRWVGVYLSVVKTRNGTRYYSKMSVELSVSGKLRWESGTYQSGWWGHFPNVWPWF